MTIIQFQPTNAEKQAKKTTYQPQEYRYNNYQREADTYEFVDYELPDLENSTFFSKIKNIFSKDITPKNSLTDKEAYTKSKTVMCNSIVTRNEIAGILEMAASTNSKRYFWQLYNKGVDISFEEDNLGRGVMLEKDLQGNLKRKTTFYLTNLEIVSIEEISKKYKGIDKISFFDSKGAHFEVKKGMTSENKIKEFYSFEDGRPSMYKRNCTRTTNGLVGKEEYIF